MRAGIRFLTSVSDVLVGCTSHKYMQLTAVCDASSEQMKDKGGIRYEEEVESNDQKGHGLARNAYHAKQPSPCMNKINCSSFLCLTFDHLNGLPLPPPWLTIQKAPRSMLIDPHTRGIERSTKKW